MEHTKVQQPTTLADARGRRAPRLRLVEPSRLGNIVTSSARVLDVTTTNVLNATCGPDSRIEMLVRGVGMERGASEAVIPTMTCEMIGVPEQIS